MSQRRNLTFSDEAVAIMDAHAPGNAVGEWISGIIINCYGATAGVTVDESCGEMGAILPTLNRLLQQNALLLAEVQTLRGSTGRHFRTLIADRAAADTDPDHWFTGDETEAILSLYAGQGADDAAVQTLRRKLERG